MKRNTHLKMASRPQSQSLTVPFRKEGTVKHTRKTKQKLNKMTSLVPTSGVEIAKG